MARPGDGPWNGNVMSAFSAKRRILSLWLPRLPIDRIKRLRARANGDGQVENVSASSWPGLSQPSTSLLPLHDKDVDARHKAGHDESVEKLGDTPSVVVAKESNALLIYSLDDAAARYGLTVGQPLAN